MPRRGENIYKRKDGRWEGRYLKEYDCDNKAKYGSVYAKTYLEVKQKLQACKGATAKTSVRTFGHYKERWLESIKKYTKQSTYIKYNNLLKNHISECFDDKLICNINTAVVNEFILKKLSGGKLSGTGGLSPKTVKDIKSVLKLITDHAAELGEKSFCDFGKIKIKSEIKKANVLSKREQAVFSSYLMKDTDYAKLGVLICLYTGLRIGEICALKFSDISDGIIHVTKTMQRVQNTDCDYGTKTSIVISPPKSFCSVRDVPIPKFLNELIMRNYVENAYVLTGNTELFVEPRTLQNKFKFYTAECGINSVNFHAIRHSFATRCVESGVDIKALSEILGHSSVSITLNRYVHISMEAKRKNIEKIKVI